MSKLIIRLPPIAKLKYSSRTALIYPMISSKELWKKELLVIAHSLLRRLAQTKWSDKSIYRLEKELFVGFFSVRKLIESKAISANVTSKKFSLMHFPAWKQSATSNRNHLLYNQTPEQRKYHLTIRQISNLFIHSYHVLPFGGNGMLCGFFVTSEFERKNGIFLILIFDIVTIFRLCAGHTGLINKNKGSVKGSVL